MKIIKIVYILISVLFLLYLALPSPEYPDPISSARRSVEPADVENDLRRGYYTDLNREEVLKHYSYNFQLDLIGLYKIPNYRLNYPPEEAQVIIRDQTRSTFLEEIVYPFRESIFVNGFEPKKDNEVIVVDGYKWKQKIIVKYFPGSHVTRVSIGILTIIVGWFLIKEWIITWRKLPTLAKETGNLFINAK